MKECTTKGCERIHFWSNYCNTKPANQNKYYSIQIINDTYIICGVHLNSDLHGGYKQERTEKARQIMEDIHAVAKVINSDKVIIVGDMNEMPYGECCLSANAFHGLPFFSSHELESRIIQEKSYIKYYNPMWNLLGDFEYPPGTYYYNNSKLAAPLWYLYDQFIISRSLVPYFVKSELKIITGSKEFVLYNDNGKPKKSISDHFPIMCELLEK